MFTIAKARVLLRVLKSTPNVVRFLRQASGSRHDEGSFRAKPPPVNWIINLVPQQSAYVIEFLGKFSRVLEPGLNFLLPAPFHKIAYCHSLKEQAIPIGSQTAITRDNVTITIDGVLYVKITDAEKASYGVEDAIYAVTQMAQTTMRSELGKITLDKTFEERENLNLNIVKALNSASLTWGIECLRYEIRDISPPESVRSAMNMQAEAERMKRAKVTESEGEQRSRVNLAEGQKSATILAAQGEAAAIRARADATGDGIERLATAIESPNGQHAVSLRIAEQYVSAFSNLAKESTTILMPSNASDPASFVASSLTIYDSLLNKRKLSPPKTVKRTAAASQTTASRSADMMMNRLKHGLKSQSKSNDDNEKSILPPVVFDAIDDELFVGTDQKNDGTIVKKMNVGDLFVDNERSK
uniref:SPFH/Band 7/PHB domain-containing membrane-associated protein family n=1 Tax=Hirondellea gigas TaxID=1518452 RepID=A0A6A7G9U8_9CRUS